MDFFDTAKTLGTIAGIVLAFIIFPLFGRRKKKK